MSHNKVIKCRYEPNKLKVLNVWSHDQSLMRDNSINYQLFKLPATQIIEGNKSTGMTSTPVWLKFRSHTAVMYT